MKMYDYICANCQQPFQHRKPDKKYCSMECVREDKKSKRFEKKSNCHLCNKEFIDYSANFEMKYCSRDCSAKVIGARKTKAQTIETSCGWCKKPIIKRLSAKGITGDFCSVPCGEAFKRGNDEMFIIKNCLRCNKEYKILFRRQTDYCSRKCSSPYQSGEEHSGFGKEGPTAGMKPWTFGLTKETDERVAAMGNKVSETHKEQFASGIRSNHKEHNPNWGKTVTDRTPEQLENYSKGAIKRLMTAKRGAFIKGHHASDKAIKKEMYYRSSYEYRFMKLLDVDKNVATYQYEPFYIKCSTGSRYLPDFLVYYADGTKKLIEIKCKYTKNLKTFPAKEQSAHEYARNNNMTYEIWMLNEINAYEQQLGVTLDV